MAAPEEPEPTICETFIAAAQEDPTATEAVEVSPADYPSPMGVTLPTPADCAVLLTVGGGSQQVALLWEHGDLNAMDQAMIAAGFDSQPFSDDWGAKNQYIGPAGLTWLTSGKYVLEQGMAGDTIQFTAPI